MVRLALCFFLIALLGVCAQTIEITPAHVLIDEPTTVRVSGCQPGERLTVHAQLVDGADGGWASDSEWMTR